MPYAPTEHILIEQSGPVATITLNNPDAMNAVVGEMGPALREIWWHLSEDDSVRAVILTGAGKAFSAGGDLPTLTRMTEETEFRRRSMRGARRTMEAQAEFPKPVIAAVNGPAVGLGCNLALGCDLVFMAETAYFADTHVSVGLVCGDGGAVFWPLLMGLLRCKEYLFTGDRISAALAREYGLANRVFPEDELMEQARGMAERLAAQPPHALQDTKRALNLHLQEAILRAAPFALAAEGESFTSDHVRQTVERFTQK